MTPVVVPAQVPSPHVLRVAEAPPPAAAVVPLQPRPVPAAHPVALQTARADAETVRLLQAELDQLRARVAG